MEPEPRPTVRAERATCRDAVPDELVAQVRTLITRVRDVYGDRAPTVLARLHLTFALPYTGAAHTPVRRQQATNHAAYGDLVRHVALGEAAIAAFEAGHATHEDAVQARDRLIAVIDGEAERPVWPTRRTPR